MSAPQYPRERMQEILCDLGMLATASAGLVGLLESAAEETDNAETWAILRLAKALSSDASEAATALDRVLLETRHDESAA